MGIARLFAVTVAALALTLVALSSFPGSRLPAEASSLTTAGPAVKTLATTATVSTVTTTVPAVTVPAPQPAPAVPTPTVIAAAAPAVTVSTSRPGLIGAQAVALLTYPWAQLGYRLTFHGPKSGFLGLTDCTAHTIDIYVTASQTVAQVEYITAFEIAHAVDCTHTSAAREAQWPVLRGFQIKGSWFPNCTCSENSYASGDFADAFARWQAGAAYPWRSTLAPAPTATQLAALVPFLEG